MDSRNETVDALRGLAALSVCLFHLCSPGGQPILHSLLPIGDVTQYGFYGVTVFFVISGFIVPYAMDRADYRVRHFPQFLLRRLVRLEPPYMASAALVVLLGIAAAATPGFRGPPYEWSVPQVLSHGGYLTGLLGYKWLNVVYWTLALELQFYLLIAVLFPLLACRRPAVQIAVVIVCAAAPLLIPSIPEPRPHAELPTLIVPFLPTFAAGILTFMVSTGRAQNVWYWSALVLLTGLAAWRDGMPAAFATAATAGIIATVRLPRFRPLAFLGAISYSLYLLHVPIGSKISNLAYRLGNSLALEIVVFLGTVAACIASAAIFYHFVEQPSVRLAAKITYNGRSRLHRPDASSPLAAGAATPHP